MAASWFRATVGRVLLALGVIAVAIAWDRGWWIVPAMFAFVIGLSGYDRLRDIS